MNNKKMKYNIKQTGQRLVMLLGLLIFSISTVFAQEKILVRGKVYSASDKEPLIGARVVEINRDNRIVAGTTTNLDGDFSLYVTDTKNKLEVSYVGYKKQQIPIGTNTNIRIGLRDDNILEEVTVTAKPRSKVGDLQIDDRDISMSVSKLDASEISELHVASIDEAIQGRMSGVDIVANAGDPGSGMSIRIRGVTSINGDNQPLIVVDGIPMDADIAADFDFGTATEEEYSQLLNVAPGDIKDIVVLKDAAATAIWGSRAANGVLQITTKRGSISQPKVNLRITGSFKPTPNPIPTLNGDEYSTMILESHLNAGTVLDPLRFPQFAYDPNNPVYYYNYSNNTDWVDAVSQTGYSQDYTLSVSGGTSKIRYAFSAGFYDDQGNTIGTAFQRLNTRMNLDYFVSDKLMFRADMAYTRGNKQRNYVPNSSSSSADVRAHAYTKMPNQSIYYINEFGEETPLFYTPVNNPQGTYPNVFNPVAMAEYGEYDILSDQIIPKLTIEFRPNMIWRYTFDVSLQSNSQKSKKFLPQAASGLVWSDTRTNTSSDADSESLTIQTFNKLFFTPVFEDSYRHRLIGLIGLNTYDNSGYSYGATSTNSPSSLLQDPSISSRIYPSGNSSSSFSQQRSMSVYSNLNYTFLDRYTIYGNIKVDGNSRFGKNYRFGVFPAFSGRYRLSGEPFMKGFTWLNDFSFRGSWGIAGNAPKNNYMYQSKYATYDYTYLGGAATYPSSLELKELRWENSYQANFGINFVAFDNKLNLDADYYVRTTKNQFMNNIAIPDVSGFSSMSLNYGTVENSGWELSVNYTPVRTKDLNVNLAFNIARSENVIKEISEYHSLYSGSWDVNGSYLGRVELNQPTGSFYGYRYNGVYLNAEQTIARDKAGNHIYTVDANGNPLPVYMTFGYPTIAYQFQPGDARYEDINHDGNINYQDIVYLGDRNALFHGGLTPSIKWKQFSLNMVFHYRYGNDVLNMARMNLESMRGYNNQSKAVLKRFRQSYENPDDAPNDILPRALFNKGYNSLASDRFVEDGSFIRWKSVTFRYNFKRDQIKQLGLSDLYFYLTMQNVYLWTNYKGQDPEVNMGTGTDYSQASVPKTYTLGINLSF
jgi:TonB-linked SusC/RagA family outer membrane protein